MRNCIFSDFQWYTKEKNGKGRGNEQTQAQVLKVLVHTPARRIGKPWFHEQKKKQIPAQPEDSYSVWHLSLGIQLPSVFVLLLPQDFQLFVSCFLKADKSLCLFMSFKYNTKWLLVCSKKMHFPSLIPPTYPDLNKEQLPHIMEVCGETGKGLEGKV